MTDRRIYIHEFGRLRHGRTTPLYEAMESRGLQLYEKHGIEMVGFWETIYGHGPWPETIAMWEFRDFGHYQDFLRATYDPPDNDFTLREWHEERADHYEHIQQYLCFAAEVTPSVADHRNSGIRAKMIVHETMHVEPNRQAEYCELASEMWWRRCGEPAGNKIIGIYYSPWKNTLAFNIWGMAEDWDDLNLWGKREDGNGWYETKDVVLWNKLGLAIRHDFDDRFAVPAPFSPIR